jgi:hypothetical protein
MEVVRLRRGGDRNILPNGHRASVCKMKILLRMDSGNGSTKCGWIYHNCTIKMVEIVYLTLYAIYHFLKVSSSN